MTPEEIAKMQGELANLRRWNTDLAEQLKASGVMDIGNLHRSISELQSEKVQIAADRADLRGKLKHVTLRAEEAERRVRLLARTILRVRLSGQVAGIVIDALDAEKEEK